MREVGRWLLGLAALVVLVASCASEPSPPDAGPASPDAGGGGTAGGTETMPGSPAEVIRVVDGDTILVGSGGSEVRVRLIGIDTPEAVTPEQPVECYGPEASGFTRSQLEGRTVNLEFDVERFDRFGRTLAYVWLDGVLFNEVLVARGFATVTTFPPNVKYVDRFVEAQRQAREAGRGLWGACAASD